MQRAGALVCEVVPCGSQKWRRAALCFALVNKSQCELQGGTTHGQKTAFSVEWLSFRWNRWPFSCRLKKLLLKSHFFQFLR